VNIRCPKCWQTRRGGLLPPLSSQQLPKKPITGPARLLSLPGLLDESHAAAIGSRCVNIRCRAHLELTVATHSNFSKNPLRDRQPACSKRALVSRGVMNLPSPSSPSSPASPVDAVNPADSLTNQFASESTQQTVEPANSRITGITVLAAAAEQTRRQRVRGGDSGGRTGGRGECEQRRPMAAAR
jgi:hypothetical protein